MIPRLSCTPSNEIRHSRHIKKVFFDKLFDFVGPASIVNLPNSNNLLPTDFPSQLRVKDCLRPVFLAHKAHRCVNLLARLYDATSKHMRFSEANEKKFDSRMQTTYRATDVPVLYVNWRRGKYSRMRQKPFMEFDGLIDASLAWSQTTFEGVTSRPTTDDWLTMYNTGRDALLSSLLFTFPPPLRECHDKDHVMDE